MHQSKFCGKVFVSVSKEHYVELVEKQLNLSFLRRLFNFFCCCCARDFVINIININIMLTIYNLKKFRRGNRKFTIKAS